jgi:hypothetical protein
MASRIPRQLSTWRRGRRWVGVQVGVKELLPVPKPGCKR